MALMGGQKYRPIYNWTPGMDDDQANSDRVTYATTEENLTQGYGADWLDFGSLEVGPDPYENDPMGEERSSMTFPASAVKGHIGMMATAGVGKQSTTSLQGGKSANLSNPQTYNSIAANKRNG